MSSNTNFTPPAFTSDGRTSDGRYTIRVAEYAAALDISLGTAWKHVHENIIDSFQPTGRNGRVHIPVRAVIAALGIETGDAEGSES